jgi:hypothetical protein
LSSHTARRAFSTKSPKMEANSNESVASFMSEVEDLMSVAKTT